MELSTHPEGMAGATLENIGGVDDPAALIAERDLVQRTLARMPEAAASCLTARDRGWLLSQRGGSHAGPAGSDGSSTPLAG